MSPSEEHLEAASRVDSIQCMLPLWRVIVLLVFAVSVQVVSIMNASSIHYMIVPTTLLVSTVFRPYQTLPGRWALWNCDLDLNKIKLGLLRFGFPSI